jgi:hypothetical protein
MRLIGRKLYINFGNLVVAIEKLPRVKPEDMGLTKDIPTKLVDVYEFDGERIEKPVEGRRDPGRFGWDFNRYACEDGIWGTIQEWRKLNRRYQKYCCTHNLDGDHESCSYLSKKGYCRLDNKAEIIHGSNERCTFCKSKVSEHGPIKSVQ